MKLELAIEQFQRRLAAQLSERQLRTVLLAAERLQKPGIAERCLRVGDRALAFVLPSAMEIVEALERIQVRSVKQRRTA